MDLSEDAPRDTDGLQQWAFNCGAQNAEGVQLTSHDGWYDIYPLTSSDVAAVSTYRNWRM